MADTFLFVCDEYDAALQPVLRGSTAVNPNEEQYVTDHMVLWMRPTLAARTDLLCSAVGVCTVVVVVVLSVCLTVSLVLDNTLRSLVLLSVHGTRWRVELTDHTFSVFVCGSVDKREVPLRRQTVGHIVWTNGIGSGRGSSRDVDGR